jgi:hypothetical protein
MPASFLATYKRDTRICRSSVTLRTPRSNRAWWSAQRASAFVLRAEVRQDGLRIEVEDAGGPWRDGPRDGGRPHGFDVVAAVAGPGNWSVDGDARGRVAWARLGG